MRYLLLVLLIFCAFVTSHAQETNTTICDLTLIRDRDAGTLSIEGADGSIGASYSLFSYYDLQESSDCRFVTVFLRFTNDWHLKLYVFDGQTGQELGNTFDSIYEWSPDNQVLLLQTSGGIVLWDFMNNLTHTISEDNINRYYPRIIWSPSRGLLFHSDTPHNRAVLENDETVRAYNWLTGELVAEYTNLAAEDIETGMELSANERYLMVYSLHSYPEHQGITVYDLDMGMSWMLDSWTEEFINDNAQLEMSPDGRYLVAANRHLWVWELPLMTDSSIEHRPTIFYGPDAWVENFVFVSPTVIEVRDSGGYLSRWDVSNGEPVS
jgi:hypothetical protein